MNQSLLLLFVVGYIGSLVFIGKALNKRKRSSSWFDSLVYALSMGAYCTAWTYFGSVEKASLEGMSFLAVYAGPIIGSFFWRGIWHKLILIKERYSITSLADLIALRHGKSQLLATFVSVFLFIGMVPYISLQLKALLRSTHWVLNAGNGSVNYVEGFLVIGVLLALTIYFGLRKLNPTERHPGLVYTSAFESLIKVLSFLFVGGILIYSYKGGLHGIFSDFNSKVELGQLTGLQEVSTTNWISVCILSFFAFLFLPRQFHLAVVESTQTVHLSRATWMFPLYLILINLFVLPIAMLGLVSGLANKDLYLLELSGNYGFQAGVFLVYLGGLSAVIGMVIVEVTTLSTMVSSNMILPIVSKFSTTRLLSSRILLIRWVAGAAILILSLIYLDWIGDKYALVSIGMISFSAIFQLVPSVIGGLYWNRGSFGGALLSLLSGSVIWFLTLLLPALAKSGVVSNEFLQKGYFGISMFKPEAFMGITGLDPITHSFIWSSIIGSSFYIVGSILLPQTRSEELVAIDIVKIRDGDNSLDLLPEAPQIVPLESKRRLMLAHLQKYFSLSQSNHIIDTILERCKLVNRQTISVIEVSQLASLLEAALAGAIGAAQAHVEIVQLNIFTENEKKDLENHYSELLAQMNVSPADLMRRMGDEKKRNDHLSTEAEWLQTQLVQKSKMMALGEMAAGVAHEENNPLTIIRLNLQMLRQKAEKGEMEPDKLATSLDKAMVAVDRIGKVITGLLTFSKHSEDSPIEAVLLKDLIDQSLAFCQARFNAQNVEVQVSTPPELLVHCRPVQMQQVIINLMNNSFEAIQNLEDKWIRLDFSFDGNILKIKVVDSGKGIAEEISRKIMQPFFSTKPLGKGMGLGLSTSMGIVEQHGGKLYHLKGQRPTTFVIELPIL